MQYRKLGYTELELSTIGLGTWAMGGGDWNFGWGPQEDKASEDAIRAAIDQGINWIDTAAIYGHGHSETVVGKAIKEIRNSLFIATKCGRVWEGDSRDIGKSLKADSIRKEVEASLQRLQIEVIDLYQIHWPEPDQEIEEGWATVSELIKEGKVRYGGVSNFNLAQLKRAQAIHPIASLQPPYSMLRREIEEEIIPYCGENQIGILAYSPMQAGLLTGKFSADRVAQMPQTDWRTKHPFFREPQLSVHLKIVEGLKNIAEQKGISLPQLALAWVLRKKEMTSAIVGARKPSQIIETAKAGDIILTSEEINQVEEVLAIR
ncbi:aldo/keto reductase [Muriicola sp. Z0-33]|uniref:aldo/keto reductase n=1 Tax=Muriicola sp. Z0-33 TaxID=2816957 RepID=UPI00223831DF|nr:aldo/keto reductase [Muriicola sp. Z0-33]MCW5515260.1 aldo/keto reductase [Muriicola sp. Z0-33]